MLPPSADLISVLSSLICYYRAALLAYLGSKTNILVSLLTVINAVLNAYTLHKHPHFNLGASINPFAADQPNLLGQSHMGQSTQEDAVNAALDGGMRKARRMWGVFQMMSK